MKRVVSIMRERDNVTPLSSVRELGLSESVHYCHYSSHQMTENQKNSRGPRQAAQRKHNLQPYNVSLSQGLNVHSTLKDVRMFGGYMSY